MCKSRILFKISLRLASVGANLFDISPHILLLCPLVMQIFRQLGIAIRIEVQSADVCLQTQFDTKLSSSITLPTECIYRVKAYIVNDRKISIINSSR